MKRTIISDLGTVKVEKVEYGDHIHYEVIFGGMIRQVTLNEQDALSFANAFHGSLI